MPYARKNYRANAKRFARRRGFVTKKDEYKAKYQKGSAKNQKSQIIQLTKAVRTLQSQNKSTVLYNPFWYARELSRITAANETVIPLINPVGYAYMFRPEQDIIDSRTAKILSMDLRLHFQLHKNQTTTSGMNNPVSITVVFFRLKKTGFDGSNVTNPITQMGLNYVFGTGHRNLQFNPKRIKLLARREFQLADRRNYRTISNSLSGTSPSLDEWTQDCHVKLNLGTYIKNGFSAGTSAAEVSWTVMGTNDINRYSQVYMAIFHNGQSIIPDTDENKIMFSFTNKINVSVKK